MYNFSSNGGYLLKNVFLNKEKKTPKQINTNTKKGKFHCHAADCFHSMRTELLLKEREGL